MKYLFLMILFSSCSFFQESNDIDKISSEDIESVSQDITPIYGEKVLADYNYKDSLEVAIDTTADTILTYDKTSLAKKIELQSNLGWSWGWRKVIYRDKVTEVADIPSPVYNGDTLQATDFHFLSNNKVAVSYNYSGDKYLGAVQIIDVTNKNKPKILTTLIINNHDVNNVYMDYNYLYLSTSTEASELTGLSTPAALIILKHNNFESINISDYKLIDLPSFAATKAWFVQDSLYVTVGDIGGKLISIYKPQLEPATGNLKLSDFKYNTRTFEDARYIDSDNTYIAALSGENKLWYMDRNSKVEKIIDIGDGATVHAKSTVDILEDGGNKYAFIALNAGGLKIYDLETGTLVQEIEQAKSDTIPQNLTVTNGVSASWNQVLYTADGEYGVRTYFKSWWGAYSDKYNQIGHITFGKGISANSVKYWNERVFVACGTAGLKVLKVDRKQVKVKNKISEDEYYSQMEE